MQKEKLVQYKDLEREIIKLEKRIEKEKTKIEHDKVQGSNTEYPYNLLHLNIEGVVFDDENTKKLYKILNDRHDKTAKLKLEIEVWIASIPDSRTRQVFEMRYIDNASWQRISNSLGSHDESFARKIHDRYLLK